MIREVGRARRIEQNCAGLGPNIEQMGEKCSIIPKMKSKFGLFRANHWSNFTIQGVQEVIVLCQSHRKPKKKIVRQFLILSDLLICPNLPFWASPRAHLRAKFMQGNVPSLLFTQTGCLMCILVKKIHLVRFQTPSKPSYTITIPLCEGPSRSHSSKHEPKIIQPLFTATRGHHAISTLSDQ